MTRILLLPILILGCLLTAAQTRVSVGFYNVENLFDTIPSLFYDDSPFTPNGRNRWNTERYNHKLTNIARVIDQMGLDVVGLCEVESETVVRDLVTKLHTDYNYIHRTSGDRRGMDIVLLYKGDKFVPETVRQIKTTASRKPLYIRGKLVGERVDIVVCHLPSLLNNERYRESALRSLYRFADSLHRADPDARLVMMGDYNGSPKNRSDFLFNPLAPSGKKGFGTYVNNDRWVLYDNIFLDQNFLSSSNLQHLRSGIFIKDYLLDRDGVGLKGYPHRTITSGRYTAGFSDHLPVFIMFELRK